MNNIYAVNDSLTGSCTYTFSHPPKILRLPAGYGLKMESDYPEYCEVVKKDGSAIVLGVEKPRIPQRVKKDINISAPETSWTFPKGTIISDHWGQRFLVVGEDELYIQTFIISDDRVGSFYGLYKKNGFRGYRVDLK